MRTKWRKSCKKVENNLATLWSSALEMVSCLLCFVLLSICKTLRLHTSGQWRRLSLFLRWNDKNNSSKLVNSLYPADWNTNAWVCFLALPISALGGICEISRHSKNHSVGLSEKQTNKAAAALTVSEGACERMWWGMNGRRTEGHSSESRGLQRRWPLAHCLHDFPLLYQSVSN